MSKALWICTDCAMGEEVPCRLECSSEEKPVECPFGNGEDCDWSKKELEKPTKL